MNKEINNNIKPLLAISLSCAIGLQNVSIVSNANEVEISQDSIDNQDENLDNNILNNTNAESSVDTFIENEDLPVELPDDLPEEEIVEAPTSEFIQIDPGSLNNMSGSAFRSALPNLDIVQLTNPKAIGSGKIKDIESVNIRSGPSTSYSQIGTLKLNDSFEILGISNGWYKIDFNGKEGYVSPTYVMLNALDKGIDVSKWNGTINWQKVKASGVNYAIIRAGYGTSTVDPTFEANMQGALNAGIKVGVYWFSYATTVEEAKLEAQKCLSLLAPYKGRVDYPVFFDYEYDSVRYAKDKGITITKNLASEMAKAFLNTVKAQGYATGIYTNRDFSQTYYYDDLIYSNTIWSAQYNSTNTFNKPYSMWQYSEKGVVPGISGAVDLNYTTLKTFNTGLPVDPTPDPEPPTTTGETGTTTENVNFRSSTSTSASIITTIKKGTKVEVIDKSISGWYKIKYNNQTGYVSSQYVKLDDSDTSTPPSTTSETGTTTENVNFRTSASTSASIITTIKKGSKVEVIDKSTSGWYKIKYNNQTGYVSNQYVKLGDGGTTTPTPPPTTSETGTTTENVNFRTSASTSASIISTIKKGSKVEVIDKSTSGWYKVKYNNQTGYVSSQYVSLGNGGTTTPTPPPTTSETGVTTANLNFRKSASTSASIISTIPKGSKVEILDKNISGWLKIKFNNKTGYVSSQYVSINGSITTPPTTTNGTTTENVNLRSGASTSAEIIMTIKKGSIVEILDKSNSSWYKVKFSSKTGYVSSQYIK